jgi:hypothetical protein
VPIYPIATNVTFPETQQVSGTVTATPDVPGFADAIQYQLDHNGPITRPEDIANGLDYYVNNISGAFSVYDPDTISALGNQSNNVATSDTGVFSIISLIKRGLQNWTTLLAKIPALVSGRIPVDGSGVTQPVSLASVPTHGVTGTFWQATQPVSGTFWQATQPVSIASAISQKVQGWDIAIHDYRGLGYTSGNLTSVTYKTGGSSGTTVATLTLGYDGSGNLTSVTKT